MDNYNFLRTLNEFIEITNEISTKLKEELDWINGHHARCIAAKSVGTAASVSGAAVVVGSLILAPITGGASIVAATGYGAMVAAAGAGVNLVTDITDMITQRIEKSQIEDICARRNQVANHLKEYFDELERVAIELKALKVEENDAYSLSLIQIVKKGKSIKASADDIRKLSTAAQLASGASNMCLRNGGYFWKGMRTQSETLMKALGFFGFNVTKTGAMAVIRSGTIFINGAFAIYDVYSLIQTIKNNDPTADAISKMIKNMNEELAQIGELRKTAIDIQGLNGRDASIKCPHCSGLLHWKYGNYHEGCVQTCVYDNCKKTFQQVNCPHCNGSMVWKNADYKQGTVQTCVYDNCKKTFQQVNCPHCIGSMVWKNADYKGGTVQTCVYDNCKKTFQQVNCPHCNGSMVWKNADYKQGTVQTCVYDNCKKTFQQVN